MSPRKRKLLVYDYPPNAVKVAEKRVDLYLKGIHLFDHNLRQLLINVYLQGVKDAFEAVDSQSKNPQFHGENI